MSTADDTSRGASKVIRAALDDVRGETLESQRMRDAVRSRLFGGRAQPVELGRYRVLGLLGKGGMGVVYAAHDPVLDRKVAIKLLLGEVTDATSERLRHEAEALAAIAHPNVIAIYEIGWSAQGLFVVMELVEGRSLAQWIAREQSWTRARFTRALELLLQAGRGLAAAHAVGLVHRDFKPANVLVGDDGRVRVADFGLARSLRPEEHEPTATDDASGRAGTPAYMAPEQIDGAAIDARSDQFAFCVTAWEAIYGVAPFAGRTAFERRVAILDGVIEPIMRTGVPRKVAAVLAQGLADAPAARHRDLRTLLASLDATRPRARVGFAAVVGAGALATVAALALPSIAPQSRAQPCAITPLDAWWRADGAPRLEASAAAHELDRIDAALGFYAQRYDDAWQRACRGESPLPDAVACLVERRDAFELVVDGLAAAPDVLAAQGVLAVDELVDPEGCLRNVDGSGELDALHRELSAELAASRLAFLAGRIYEAIARDVAVHARAYAAGRPELDARARLAIGRALSTFGSVRAPREWFVAAHGLAVQSGDDESAARAAILVMIDSQELAGDEQIWRGHAEAALARLGESTELLAEYWSARGWLAQVHGDGVEAQRAYEHALALKRDVPSAAPLWHIGDLVGVADALTMQGHAREATPWLREALQAAEDSVGPRHSLTLKLRGALAANLQFEDPAASRALFEAVLAEEPRVIGADSQARAVTLVNFAILEIEQGRAVQAIPLLDRARELVARELGAQSIAVAEVRYNIGGAFHRLGELDESAQELRAALEVFHAESHCTGIVDTTVALANVTLERGRPGEAADMLAAAQKQCGAELDEGSLAQLMYFHAAARFEVGEFSDARALASAAFLPTASAFGARSHRMGELLTLRGDLEEQSGSLGEAIASYVEADDLLTHALPVRWGVVGYARYRLAQLRWAAGDRRAARAAAQAALAAFAEAGDTATSRTEVEAWLAAHR